MRRSALREQFPNALQGQGRFASQPLRDAHFDSVTLWVPCQLRRRAISFLQLLLDGSGRTPFSRAAAARRIRAISRPGGRRFAAVISSSFVREKSSSPPRFHAFRMRCARWRVFSRVKCGFLDGQHGQSGFQLSISSHVARHFLRHRYSVTVDAGMEQVYHERFCRGNCNVRISRSAKGGAGAYRTTRGVRKGSRYT